MFNPLKDRNGIPKRGKQFEQVQLENVNLNLFNLSYNSRGSYNMMWLYPVDFQKMEPGDTYSVKRSAIIKAAPMVAPIYQKIDVYFYTFKIPLRILHRNYNKMRSPGNGTVSLAEALSYDAPDVPTWTFQDLYNILDFDTEGSEDADLTLARLSTHSRFRLLDELNMPSPVTYAPGTGTHSGTVVASLLQNDLAALSFDKEPWSVLPLRAYYKVWYDYFRDQNNYSIAEPLDSDTVTSSELARICQLRPKAWEHDYFTSALLTPQRGPAVNIELFNGESGVNIDFTGITIPGASTGKLLGVDIWNSGQSYSNKLSTVNRIDGTGILGIQASLENTQLSTGAFNLNNVTVPHAQMTNVTQGTIENATFQGQGVITINQLRTYSKMQEWLEIQARCGARYNEFLLSNFGVVSSDARLQRPEFVAGGMMPLTISDVVNQSASNLGSYSGMAEGQSGDLDKFSTYADEDCYLLTLMTIMPHTSYSQGVRRYWTQKSTFDFYLPKFAQLGEEPVLNEELYYTFGQNNESLNKGTFGYQSRYQWMRYNPDTIHGDFRTTYNHWTLSRLFYQKPVLGYNFISGENIDARNAQLYRFFQVTDPYIDHFYIDIWHDIIGERPLPEYNVPNLS